MISIRGDIYQGDYTQKLYGDTWEGTIGGLPSMRGEGGGGISMGFFLVYQHNFARNQGYNLEIQ